MANSQVNTKGQANVTHYQVGKEVRDTIKRLGGTLPEDLPTPAENIQEVERKEQKRLQQDLQPPLLDE